MLQMCHNTATTNTGMVENQSHKCVTGTRSTGTRSLHFIITSLEIESFLKLLLYFYFHTVISRTCDLKKYSAKNFS